MLEHFLSILYLYARKQWESQWSFFRILNVISHPIDVYFEPIWNFVDRQFVVPSQMHSDFKAWAAFDFGHLEKRRD